jgi:hypothetical protein
MRLPCDWLFGALSVPPMLLLSVPLLCAPPVFGQTAAPAPGQAPSYPDKDIAGFRAYFVQVMAIESLADQLKAQGKDDTTVRGAIQKAAQLSDQEAGLLKQVAQPCNAAYAAQTALGTSAVYSLRQQYPPVAGASPPAALTQQLAALEASRTAIISGCMQQLQTGMGRARFGYLDLYVLVRVGSKLKQGSLQPGAQGAAIPKGAALPR